MVAEELDALIEDGALAAPYLDGIKAILDADVEEDEMAKNLRAYWNNNVLSIEEAALLSDLLQATKIITKFHFRKLYDHKRLRRDFR